MSQEKKFYVYVHKYAFGPKKGQVFYVGKGYKERWRYSGEGRSKEWRDLVGKYEFTPETVFFNVSEICALSLEKAVISFYGRENLVNKTDGGEGVSGYSHTQDSKTKMSGPRPNAKQWLKGKSVPDWLKVKLRDAKLGVSQSESHASKSRVAKLGKKVSDTSKLNLDKRKPVINSDGEVFESVNEAARSLSVRLGVNVSQGNISMVLLGKRNTAYGYKWGYFET